MKKRPLGIDPLVDFAFKLLFGSPEHVRVTIHFLNAILGAQAKITHVTIQNPFLGKDNDDDKLSILDILATDDQGRQFNIEVQTTLPAGLRQRLAYYNARLYVDQIAEGVAYHDLKPAIVICVLNQPLFPRSHPLHSDFRLRDEVGLVLTNDLQVHMLELTKLTVTRENLAKATPLEQWSWFLVSAAGLTPEDVRQVLPDPEFAEAAEILKMIEKTPEQRRLYNARMKLQMDEASRRLEEAARIEQGRQEGLQEGLEKGLAKGRQEGKLLGRVQVLLELLGLETPTTEELSGYDPAQVAALAQQLQKQLRDRPQ